MGLALLWYYKDNESFGSQSVGSYSIAISEDSQANGESSIAIGQSASSAIFGSISIGAQSSCRGVSSIALGTNSQVEDNVNRVVLVGSPGYAGCKPVASSQLSPYMNGIWCLHQNPTTKFAETNVQKAIVVMERLY